MPGRDELAALLADLPPIDRMKLEAEIAGNQVRPQAEAEKARRRNLEEAAGLTPLGVPMAMRDAWNASGRGAEALGRGQAGEAGSAYVDMAASLLGLAPGALATSKAAGEVAKGASSRTNIFAGPEAKTADLDALARAMEERVAGASRDDTWKRQGWAWDERDLPYFEIDDSAAKLSGAAKPQQFGDFLGHPQLKAALPDVGAHRFSQSQPAGGGAFYAGMPGQIDVGPGDPRKQLSIALHEGQHAADESRGGSFGANSRFADPADEAAASERLREVYGDNFTRGRDLRVQRAEMLRDPNIRVDSPELMSLDSELFTVNRALEAAKSKEGLPTDPALYAYLHNPGEVRARNTEARRGFSAAERRESPPWTTIDVDEADILRGGAPSSAPSQVFVPIDASDKYAGLARELREEGGQPQDIWRKTGSFPEAGGQIVREIPDTGITTSSGFKPGAHGPAGDFINHPELFDRMPDLRNLPMRVTGAATGAGQGLSYHLPDGSMSISNAGDPRAGIAKMLQYEIANAEGFPASVRHGKDAITDNIAKAIADTGQASIGRQASPDAMHAYRQHLAQAENDFNTGYSFADPKKHGVLEQNMARKSAGNAMSAAVKARADQPQDVLERYYPMTTKPPYLGSSPKQRLPSMGSMWTLPPNGSTPQELQNFVQRWYETGAGKPAAPMSEREQIAEFMRQQQMRKFIAE